MTGKITSNKEITNWTCFTIGLLASWILSFLFFTMPFGFIIWLVCLIILFRNKSKLRWFLIVFSGWIGLYMISFSIGVKDYFAGEAELIGGGLPGPEYASLDPKYRVHSTSSGCMVIGFELITNPARNAAIKTCITLFGYQKGTYLGYYPTRKEVQSALETVQDTISFEIDGRAVVFNLNGKQYKVKDVWGYKGYDTDSCYTAQATIMKNEVLLFRPLCSDGYSKYTVIAEKGNGKPIVWYYDFMEKYQ
jgi:hypothetical protein